MVRKKSKVLDTPKKVKNYQEERIKTDLIFQPLESLEDLKNWMSVYLDIMFPSGTVYPTSTHGPADAMWRIYELMKTGQNEEIPQVCMLASRDSYKCNVAGTKILTKQGVVNIEDIKIGDIVWSGWNWRKVTDWIDDGYKDGIKTIFTNGTTVTNTSIHRFWCKRDNVEQWIAVKDLLVGDMVLYQGIKNNDIEFKTFNTTWIYVRSQEKLDSVHFYDLTVEEDHSYWSNGVLSHNTLAAAAIEVLCMLHFKLPISHLAAIKNQSQKSIQYTNSFFRKLKPYLEAHGWENVSESKSRIEWVTPEGDSVYLQVVVCTIQGANSEHTPMLCVGKEVNILCENTNIKSNRIRIKKEAQTLYKHFMRGDNPRVYTINHETGSFEFKPVIAAYKQKKELFEVEFDNNTKLQLGVEHPMCNVNGVYKPLSDFQVGDSVLYLGKRPSDAKSHLNQKPTLTYKIPQIKTTKIEQVLLGSILGDAGCYKKPQNNAYYKEQHCLKQKEYLKWKAEILKTKFHVREFKAISGFTGGELYGINTGNTSELNKWAGFKNNFDVNLLKKLSPLGLAIWFMDDGTTGTGLQFNTQSFTMEQQIQLQNILKENFDINVNIVPRKNYRGGENYNILEGGVREKYKLYQICKEYIHPDLLYKFDTIINNTIKICKYCGKETTTIETGNSGHYCNSIICRSLHYNQLHLKSITSIKSLGIQDAYDFTIQDNHNFFANNTLTHNCLDEVDVIQNPQALKEAKMIPCTYKGHFPLTVYLSTRKFKGGLMEQTLLETEKMGGEILRWNIVDVCERITPEIARVDEPKVLRYITDKLPMSNVSPEEYSLLPEAIQANYVALEAYAGIALHPMLPVMRNLLVDRPQTDYKGLFKPLSAVHNNFKQVDAEMAEAQLLCNKPSSQGLVYPRFNEENELTVKQALIRLSGADSNIDSFDYLVQYLKNLGAVFIGGADWGFTHYTALVVFALLPGGEIWLIDSLIEKELELDDICVRVMNFQQMYGIDRWYLEQVPPAYIKTLKRKGRPYGFKAPKFTKVVEDGIAAVRTKIVNADGIRKFFVVKHPEKLYNEFIIKAFGLYSWSLDNKGEIIEGKPKHDAEGRADSMDAIRYPFQNLFKGNEVSMIVGGEKQNTGEVSINNNQFNIPINTDHKTNHEIALEMNQRFIQEKIHELANGAKTIVERKGKKKILVG